MVIVMTAVAMTVIIIGAVLWIEAAFPYSPLFSLYYLIKTRHEVMEQVDLNNSTIDQTLPKPYNLL
ncbi:hypothetical protein E2C01_019837 [Portunus trituberculatus]|uniref:Uncharacterized protein n=1 Tax=Portunus trituberculatus TaxID=210409 RepID=A0A5B7DYQ1_PORTR|nr:hypothetical protein [Portunus trituberculatus]